MKVLGALRGALLALCLAAAACGGAYAEAIARGDQFAEADQWDEAAAAYEKAVSIDPDDPEAKIKLKQARRKQAAERLSRAESLEKRGELSSALTLVQEAVELDGESAAAQKALTRITTKVLDRAEKLRDAGELREAFDLTQKVLAGAAHHPRAKKLDDELRTALAKESFERARAFADRDQLGNALVGLAACLTYRPDYPDAKLQLGQVKLKLEQELRFFAVLDRFQSKGDAAAVSQLLKPELLQQSIDDRLLLEVATKPPENDAAKGVRVTGELAGYDYDRSKKTQTRSCDYVCGTKYEPNPAIQRLRGQVASAERALSRHDDDIARKEKRLLREEKDLAREEEDAMEAQADVDEARQRLSDCRANASPDDTSPCSSEESRLRSEQSALDRARSDVERARSDVTRLREAIGRLKSQRETARQRRDDKKQELLRTPEQIAVDKYCPHEYAVEKHATAAEITLELTLDQLGGDDAIVAGEPFDYDARDSDETFPAQQGRCDEVASGDPLELASEKELRKRLTNEIIKDLRSKIVASYDAYRRGFLTAARRHEAAGNTEQATEAYVRYVLTGPHELEDADELGAFFERTRGLGELDALWKL